METQEADIEQVPTLEVMFLTFKTMQKYSTCFYD